MGSCFKEKEAAGLKLAKTNGPWHGYFRSMRIVDAHTHFFSRRFFQLLAEEAARAKGGDLDALILEATRKAGIELPEESPSRHAQRWLSELDRHGIDRAVAFASLPGEAAAVSEACLGSNGRLIPYLLVNPASAAGLEAGRKALSDEGFKGILLFPALHRFDPSDPGLDPLYAEAGARRAPVVVHCGLLQIKLRDLLGVRPQYDLRHANPLLVAAAAERNRKTAFVIPHFGAGFFREALLAGAQSENTYLDTSSSNSWMRLQAEDLTLEKVFRKTLEAFGPRRILFGTDSSTFPRGYRSDVLGDQRRALKSLGLDEPDQARIFGENLLELLS